MFAAPSLPVRGNCSAVVALVALTVIGACQGQPGENQRSRYDSRDLEDVILRGSTSYRIFRHFYWQPFANMNKCIV
jgi:hypothetical protein